MPELTRREVDVVAALCKPALCDDAFVAPATARDIAADLVVTEAAVKQHLLRLYQKLKIAEGPNRRVRLANEVVALGPGPAAAAVEASAARPAARQPPDADHTPSRLAARRSSVCRRRQSGRPRWPPAADRCQPC